MFSPQRGDILVAISKVDNPRAPAERHRNIYILSNRINLTPPYKNIYSNGFSCFMSPLQGFNNILLTVATNIPSPTGALTHKNMDSRIKI